MSFMSLCYNFPLCLNNRQRLPRKTSPMTENQLVWNANRLLQLKKDVRNLQDSLENIVRVAYSADELNALLHSDACPAELKDLASHPLVSIGNEIKSNLELLKPILEISQVQLPSSAAAAAASSSKDSTSQLTQGFKRHKIDPSLTEQATLDRIPNAPKIENSSTLDIVFTHCSAANNPSLPVNVSNERLTIIGDGILRFVLSDILYRRHQYKPSEMAVLRQSFLANHNLSRWCMAYSFESHLITDVGNMDNNNMNNDPFRNNGKVSANLFQAYVGGLYLDSGYSLERVKPWISELLNYDIKSGNISVIQSPLQQTTDPRLNIHQLAQKSAHSADSNLPSQSNSASSEWVNLGLNSSVQLIGNSQQEQKPKLKQKLSRFTQSVQASDDQIRMAKEGLYKKVNPPFIPEYRVYSKALSTPWFKIACLIQNEVVGLGEGSNTKVAGAQAAYNALTWHSELVDKYENLARDIKSGAPKFHPSTLPSFETQLAAMHSSNTGGVDLMDY